MSTRREIRSVAYAAFQGDEIIVAHPHLDQVREVLRLAGAHPGDVERSSALGLARLTLPDTEQAAEAVRTFLISESIDPPPGRPTDRSVDRLLTGLRAFFAARHAGWTPTMGKNRLVGAVNGGGGAISHGGGGTPTPEIGRALPPRGTGPGQNVRVGVLDTGLAPQPWLGGGWVAGYSDRLPKAATYGEGAGHATFVTGLVLSQAPGATVVVRKVLTQDEEGEYSADCWTVANAIVEMGRTGIDILNLSLVCYTEDGQPPLLLSTAISRLDRDIVVVAAAGNHGDLDHREVPTTTDPTELSKPTFPAALDGVIAVGAASAEGEPASFTPLNKYWIDMLAPGVDVLATYINGKVLLDNGGRDRPEDFDGLARWSGSSFAAALISGAIAAGTQPGRVTARRALQDIQRAVRRTGSKDRPDSYLPPFVPLDLPTAEPR
jgi:subtilisin family serine protease